MRRISNKKKGTTLIEVLISVAIFSIVTIPLSMMVISSIVNNKKGENKQYAVSVAQQIIEQVRANNTTQPGIVTIKTDKTYELRFPDMPVTTPGHDRSYVVSNSDVGNGMEATVTFERKLAYDSESTTNTVVEYDLSIIMNDNKIEVNGTKDAQVNATDLTYNLTDDLIIRNMNDHTIQLLANNSSKDLLGTYKSSGVLPDNLIDNIKISYLPNYGPHEIRLENNATNPLSVYIFKQENEKENTYTNLKGSIKFYDNLPSSPIESNNGVYDITVDIYKVGSPNNVKVYSTKTSISIGT